MRTKHRELNRADKLTCPVAVAGFHLDEQSHKTCTTRIVGLGIRLRSLHNPRAHPPSPFRTPTPTSGFRWNGSSSRRCVPDQGRRRYVLAALCGYSQVDYKKLAAAVGVNRTDSCAWRRGSRRRNWVAMLGGVAPFTPERPGARRVGCRCDGVTDDLLQDWTAGSRWRLRHHSWQRWQERALLAGLPSS